MDIYLLLTVSAEFALMVLGAIVALKEDWAKKHTWSILAAFVALGAMGMYATIKTSQKSAVANHELSDSVSALGKASQDIQRETALNTALQQRLLKQSVTIADLSKQGIATATGGKSFCWLTFSNPRPDTAATEIMAIHSGDYPLHDVQIRMVDLQEFYKANPPGKIPTPESFMIGSTVFPPIDTFPPHTAQPLGSFVLGPGQSRALNIFFIAVNGSWNEILRLRKVNGTWKQAVRVEKMGRKKPRLVFQQIEPGFPRIKGKADWSDRTLPHPGP